MKWIDPEEFLPPLNLDILGFFDESKIQIVTGRIQDNKIKWFSYSLCMEHEGFIEIEDRLIYWMHFPDLPK